MSKRWIRGLVIRIVVYAGLVLVPIVFLYWPRGEDVRDGRHDRGRNGIWLSHAWLGDDGWFERYGRLAERAAYRDPERVAELARSLRRHHVRDVFPHLCPATPGGRIMPVDPEATRVFLDAFEGSRVMPWIGGVLGKQVHPEQEKWRRQFVRSVVDLLTTYPRLAGVHLNIEPCPSGHAGFLQLLDELRAALPEGKLLSVAAYPPPTLWHPYPEVHWDRETYQQVSRRADQIAVMLYDTSLSFPMVYRSLVADWTQEALEWAPQSQVLLGVPAYDDAGVGYHDPEVENLPAALMGIHAGLDAFEQLPDNYQGVVIYCGWEMDDSEWGELGELFLFTGIGRVDRRGDPAGAAGPPRGRAGSPPRS